MVSSIFDRSHTPLDRSSDGSVLAILSPDQRQLVQLIPGRDQPDQDANQREHWREVETLIDENADTDEDDEGRNNGTA